MNWIDLLIFIILLIGMYQGYQIGLIGQIASISTWVLGLYSSFKFLNLVSKYFKEWIDQKYLMMFSFFIIFFCIAIFIFFIKKFIELGLKIIWMYYFNKIIGAFFGIIKFLLYLLLSIFLLQKLNKYLNIISNKTLEKSLFLKEIISLNTFLYIRIHQYLDQIIIMIPFKKILRFK